MKRSAASVKRSIHAAPVRLSQDGIARAGAIERTREVDVGMNARNERRALARREANRKRSWRKMIFGRVESAIGFAREQEIAIPEWLRFERRGVCRNEHRRRACERVDADAVRDRRNQRHAKRRMRRTVVISIVRKWTHR
jgi:hypothetical protein